MSDRKLSYRLILRAAAHFATGLAITPAFRASADEARHTPTPARPIGAPAEWVSNRDAPSSSWLRHTRGQTGFMLWVDAKGTVSECIIKRSSGDNLLDQATCRALIRNGRFTPATDHHGKPVPCPWSSRVNWNL